MQRTKAVVLDLDGTLIHTTVDFRKMKQHLIQWLIDQSIPEHLVSTDMTVIENLEATRKFLIGSGREGEALKVESTANQLMSDTEMERVRETQAISGAMDALNDLRSENYSVCLLTRGSRNYALAALEAAKIDFVFDATICRDDFPESEAKPNGKALMRIAQAVKVRPEECMLVGDHTIDMECAISSSAKFVGVLTGSFDRKRWESVGVTDLIESIAQLPEFLRKAQRQ